MNKSGNLRGMVINARARSIYGLTTNIGDRLTRYESALFLASVAIEFAHEGHKAVAVWNGEENASQKAAHLSLIGSMAIFRAVTGVVPQATHLLAKSIEGYLMIGDFASGGRLHQGATHAIESLNMIDKVVTTTYKDIYSSDQMYRFINTHLVYHF
jgi:hypothetical protein